MRKTLIAVLGFLSLSSPSFAADSLAQLGTLHGGNRSPASSVQSPSLRIPTNAKPAIFCKGDQELAWERDFPIMNARHKEILSGRGLYATDSPKTALQQTSFYRIQAMRWPSEP